MKKVRSILVLVVGVFLVAFMKPPHSVVGKYIIGNPSNPYFHIDFYKIHIKGDSTFYRTIRTQMVYMATNGYWRIDGDTLILKEVIAPNEVPKNEIDSIYFDFERPYVWKLFIKDENTLITFIEGRPIDSVNNFFFICTTDEEYDKTPTLNDWL